MAQVILRYPAKCAECGQVLQAGARARFYARAIFGTECHSRQVVGTDDLILTERPPRRDARKATAPK